MNSQLNLWMTVHTLIGLASGLVDECPHILWMTSAILDDCPHITATFMSMRNHFVFMPTLDFVVVPA